MYCWDGEVSTRKGVPSPGILQQDVLRIEIDEARQNRSFKEHIRQPGSSSPRQGIKKTCLKLENQGNILLIY